MDPSRQPPRRFSGFSLLSSLVTRESDAKSIDWPALSSLCLYVSLILLLLSVMAWSVFSFWSDGWAPHGFN